MTETSSILIYWRGNVGGWRGGGEFGRYYCRVLLVSWMICARPCRGLGVLGFGLFYYGRVRFGVAWCGTTCFALPWKGMLW